MLRKIVWGGLGLLLLAVLLFCVWLRLYSVNDPARAREIRQNAVAAVKQRDELGQNAATNGYSDLQYVLTRESKPEDVAPYRALKDLSYPSSGSVKKDMLTAWTDQQDPAKKAVAQFETVLPRIDAAFAKANFIWPSQWKLGPKAPVPNFIVMRGLSQNLVGYAEYLELSGQPDKALGYYLGIMEFGGKICQNGVLIGGMIGVAIDSIGANGALEFLSRHPRLAPAALHDAITRIDRLPITGQTLLNRMDEEYAFELHSVDMLRRDPGMLNTDTDGAGKGGNKIMAAMLNYSGYLTHEQRIIENVYLQQRQSIEKLHTPAQDGQNWEDTMAMLRHNLAFIAEIVLPNSQRAVIQWRADMARNNAVMLACGLELYKLDKHQYPKTLDELVPTWLPKIPLDYLSPDQKFTYEPQGDAYKLSSALAPEAGYLEDGKTVTYMPPRPRGTR